MQVSYRKPTVNDGKEWERGGCGCRAMTVNRTLSRGATRWKLRISAAGKILYFMTQLLGQDFVVNFATYSRAYTILILSTFCHLLSDVCLNFASLSKTALLYWFTFTLVLVLQGSVATKLSYGGKFFILLWAISFWFRHWKYLKNRPTFAKVTVEIKVAQFFGLTVYLWLNGAS